MSLLVCVCVCAGAMLHKRTAVPAHMPATAADMLLPQVAPILHQAQGTCLHVPLACISNVQEHCILWLELLELIRFCSSGTNDDRSSAEAALARTRFCCNMWR